MRNELSSGRAAAKPFDEHGALGGRGAAARGHGGGLARGELDLARPGADLVEGVEVDVVGSVLPHVGGQLEAVARAAPVGDERRAEVVVAEEGLLADRVGVVAAGGGDGRGEVEQGDACRARMRGSGAGPAAMR